MKRKIIFLLTLTLIFCRCTYFKVKDAYEIAEKGDYTNSLYSLAQILKNDPEDRRTLDAFEKIYPQGERKYYNEINLTKNRDIEGYTKALLNLLRIEEIYYDLPDISKFKIAMLKPPFEERDTIKLQLSDNFYKIGNGFEPFCYEDKLRKYGFYSEAQRYNIENRKDILFKYNASKKEAEGRIDLEIFRSGVNNQFVEEFRERIKDYINSYPLFSLNNKKSNLDLDINLTNFRYIPPRIEVFSGIDSYFETRERVVMRRIVFEEMINGQLVERVRHIPVREDYDVEVFYRYERYIKTTMVEYNLSYTLKEKNGERIIGSDSKKIRYIDEKQWTKYYPFRHFAWDSFRFPMSEPEKFVMSREEIIQRVLDIGTSEINNQLLELDKNRIIEW